jgi:hypothetical protein
MRLSSYWIKRALGIGWPLLCLPLALVVGSGGEGAAARSAIAILLLGGAYAATYGVCWALGAGPLRSAVYALGGCVIALIVLRLALAPLAGS